MDVGAHIKVLERKGRESRRVLALGRVLVVGQNSNMGEPNFLRFYLGEDDYCGKCSSDDSKNVLAPIMS
jgi:hypothetical protein